MTNSDSWNKKYRPQRVSQLHLETVKNELSRYLLAGKIPQALLFSGPKGTGKTSASRIVGAILNDPKNEAAVHAAYFSNDTLSALQEPSVENQTVVQILSGTSFVVAELDAASNRGIDDIRQLRERAQLPPQGATMAVYILDEVHMLTTEAFNALLKLLEEPPEHVVFILATTELHKIPETIVSRCQMISFSKASTAELTSALEQILLAENITFEAEALTKIAQAADGSFRDAVKLIETFKNDPSVTLELVHERLHLLSSQVTEQLVASILAKNPAAISNLFAQFRSEGISAKQLQLALVSHLHSELLVSIGMVDGTASMSTQAAHFLLTHLSDASLTQAAHIPLLPLELKLLELVLRAKKQSGGTPGTKKSKPSIKNSENQQESLGESTKSHQSTPPKTTTNSGDGKLLCTQWPDLIESVAKENQTIAALLQSAEPYDGELGTLKLRVFYKFHQEQLSQPKFHQITQNSVEKISGGPVRFEYIVSNLPAQNSLEKLAVATLM
jgi:DNA polymerase III subunit gamma/tau